MAALYRLAPATLLFLIGAIAYWQAGLTELLQFDPLDAAFFPRAIAIAIMALASFDFLSSLRTLSGDASMPDVSGRAIAQAGVCFLLFVAFCLNSYFGIVPFPISGALFFLAVGLLYLDAWRPRLLLLLIGFAVGFPVLLNVIFQSLFFVSMP